MDMHDLVNVYTLSDPMRAEILRTYLQREGVRCVLDGVNAAVQMPIGAFKIHILVEAHSADRARKLLEAHEPTTKP